MNIDTHSLQTSDNLQLEVHSFLSENNHDQLILIVHGHGEHAGRYKEMAQRFNTEGFGVMALTLRGHGNSGGRKGHAPNMEQLLLDVEYFVRFVRTEFLEAQLFLYGHSMGGNLVLNYLLKDESKEISAGIVCSPWIKLAFDPPSWKTILGEALAKVFPTLTLNSGLDDKEISSIPEEVKKYQADPLIHDKISAMLFTVISKGGEKLLLKIGQLKHPVFLGHGKKDKITSYNASAQLAERYEKVTFHSYENSKHEIHHDQDAQSLFQDQVNWIRKMK